MERQSSSAPPVFAPPPEAFQTPRTESVSEKIYQDSNFPNYEKVKPFTSESTLDAPKKILPIIPPSIGGVPESLKGLHKFVTTPVTVEQVPNYTAYLHNVFPWIVNALQDAGYESQEVDTLLKKSVDTINFKKDPELYVADLNRILQNIWKQTLADTNNSTEAAVMVPIRSAEQSQTPNNSSAPMTAESKVPTPETSLAATLTPEMRAFDLLDNFQSKLNTLNEQPFNQNAYEQFYVEIHALVRDRYDALVARAQKNLKRFSNLYTPTPTEKEALQFLSTVKSQFVRMQSADSALGVTRAELINSLEAQDGQNKEQSVKTFIQDYLEGTKSLLTNIDSLNEMITVAQAEEKPALGEAYRSQFESLRIEGSKVLTTLPKNHHLYDDFKIVVEKGIADLIAAASVENDGDKAVLERSSYFISLRDRIKAAIGYIKADQEFEDFKNRQLQQVQILEMTLSTNTETLSPEKKLIKQTILDDLALAKDSLLTAGALPGGASMLSLSELTLTNATKDFATQKETIKQLLTANNEILKDLQNTSIVASEVRMFDQTAEVEFSTIPTSIHGEVPLPPPSSIEVVPGVILPTPDHNALVSNTLTKLKFYGEEADSVPLDPGISFEPPSHSEQGTIDTNKDSHTIVYGEKFWDIREENTIAGMLPIMNQIYPKYKQELVTQLRDALDQNVSLREKIGGFGSRADELVTGAVINTKALNEEATLLAVNSGYLL